MLGHDGWCEREQTIQEWQWRWPWPPQDGKRVGCRGRLFYQREKTRNGVFCGIGTRQARKLGRQRKQADAEEVAEVEESESEAEEVAEEVAEEEEKDDETSVPGASAKRKTVVALENDPQQRKVNVTVHDRKKFNLVLLMKFCN